MVKQKYPTSKINIIIVDNDSVDDTVSSIQEASDKYSKLFCSFKILQQPNLGFGAGHDRAIKEGASSYCLVTNIDLRFTIDSITNVIHEAIKDMNDRVACWELRQIPFEHPKYYDPVSLTTNWSSHACILMKRNVYLEVGGYDKKIFMYCEDVEISYRFRSFGYKLKYVPKAIVEHYTYDHAEQVKPLQFIGGVAGNLYIRVRYGNAKNIIEGLILYIKFCFSRSTNRSHKKILLKKLPVVLWNIPHFIFGKGNHKTHYPIRGLDYEMQRIGAFHHITLPNAEKADLVSIIIRTYKGRGYLLKQAMTSVINQTYPNIEIIVSEDGGECLKNIAESTVENCQAKIALIYIRNDKVGRSITGNAGMAAATGKYMMFLDDDDLLFADHVETLVSALQNDCSLSAAYSLAFEVPTEYDVPNESYQEYGFNTVRELTQEYDYDTLLRHNLFPIQSLLFKRELFDERGGFDISLEYLEDWNLWLRYGFGNKFVLIPKTTSMYRSPHCEQIRNHRNILMTEAYNISKGKAVAATAKFKNDNTCKTLQEN